VLSETNAEGNAILWLSPEVERNSGGTNDEKGQANSPNNIDNEPQQHLRRTPVQV